MDIFYGGGYLIKLVLIEEQLPVLVEFINMYPFVIAVSKGAFCIYGRVLELYSFKLMSSFIF